MEMWLSDRSFAVIFAFSGAVALNSAYLASIVLGVSRFLPLVVAPIILGLVVSRAFESPRMVVLTILTLLFIASIFTSMTLLTPVLFGVFRYRSYADWFTFIALYRLFGNMLFTAFHLIASALAGIFIWGRW